MRLKIMSFALMMVALVFVASCNAVDTTVNTNKAPANTVPETVYADGARRITTDELETLMREGKAYVVDVRTQDSFDMGHIPGSRLIPADLVAKHANELPRDKTIVTYCS